MSVSWFSNFPHCFRFFNTLLCDSLTFSSTQSWNRAQLSILRVLNPEIKLTERKGWCLHICENKITDLSTSDCVNFIYVCMFICSCVYICVCIHVAVRGGHQVSLIALQAHFLSQGLSLTLTLSSSASLAGQGAPAFYLCLPRDYECIHRIPFFTWVLGNQRAAHVYLSRASLTKPSWSPLHVFLKALICQGFSRQGDAGSLKTLGARSLNEFGELMNFIMLWLCGALFEVNGIPCMVI